MKTTNLLGLLLFSVTLLTNSGCTEENQPTSLPKTNPLTINSAENSELISFAGVDFQVILPIDFGWLSGGYAYNETIDNFVWEKISGPSSYNLESPNSLRTKVSKLEEGIYEFELTVSNKRGLTAKDRVKINVGEMSKTPQELNFIDLEWIFPWYSAVEIKNFNLITPQSIFKVYIQRDNNPNWEEVTLISEDLTNKYEYFIETRPDGAGMYNYGSLYIFYYEKDTNDSPSVKIVY
ncbi:PKD domain-containing protein [Flavobacterium maritimum]|uniref:PKD domain-containing protein n=1 Tax=Flavobacterium maritimum TaxID=3149042 RepID=UPI0032B31AE5